MIEPLTQQHALEIANDWHYEAPYDFMIWKWFEDYEEIASPEARGDRYYQVLRRRTLYGFFLLEQRERNLELGLGMKPEHSGKGQALGIFAGNSDFNIENFEPQVISLSVADSQSPSPAALSFNMGEVVRRIPRKQWRYLIYLWRWRKTPIRSSIWRKIHKIGTSDYKDVLNCGDLYEKIILLDRAVIRLFTNTRTNSR